MFTVEAIAGALSVPKRITQDFELALSSENQFQVQWGSPCLDLGCSHSYKIDFHVAAVSRAFFSGCGLPLLTARAVLPSALS